MCEREREVERVKYKQSNSVITNSTGPRKSVCYNLEFVITLTVYVVKKSEVKFVRYRCESVITVIVITEFDCSDKDIQRDRGQRGDEGRRN